MLYCWCFHFLFYSQSIKKARAFQVDYSGLQLLIHNNYQNINTSTLALLAWVFQKFRNKWQFFEQAIKLTLFHLTMSRVCYLFIGGGLVGLFVGYLAANIRNKLVPSIKCTIFAIPIKRICLNTTSHWNWQSCISIQVRFGKVREEKMTCIMGKCVTIEETKKLTFGLSNCFISYL